MLHLVHHPHYVSPAAPGSSFSFDKYGLVMRAIEELGLDHVLHRPEAMPRMWIEAVHDPVYVDQVARGDLPPEKVRQIGFPVTADVARRAFHVPGGTWLAAKLALEHGFAANSAGGSHHALYDRGAGYCVFNDLVITANRLIAEGNAARVMIIDLDVHQGDGSAVLTEGRDDIFTLSIHAERNFPVRKARSSFDIGLPDGIKNDEYIAVLEEYLPEIVDAQSPDIILYQAGVDPHGDDRLGRLALTDEGLQRRDHIVMALARSRGIAIASALGGGYGDDGMEVARRHARSIAALAQAFAAHEAADLSRSLG